MAASLAPECNDIKEQYDSCFLKWYSEKYLRDSSSADECEQLFKKYRKCMEKTLKERGIDTMLEEARKNNKENGMEFPKKTFSELPPTRTGYLNLSTAAEHLTAPQEA